MKLKPYLSLIRVDPLGLELASLYYKFICPLLVEANMELWTMWLVLSNHVGNFGSIGSILRLRVSLVFFFCFHSITLVVQVLTQEARKWEWRARSCPISSGDWHVLLFRYGCGVVVGENLHKFLDLWFYCFSASPKAHT